MMIPWKIVNVIRGIQMIGAPRLLPVVKRIFSHDPRAFTQGLAYREGLLYESTGLRNESSLRCIDPASGTILESVFIPDVFAEGIAFLAGRIYQLTWRDRRVFVYDLQPLRLAGEGRIDHEGWGLASDGFSLLASDGSSLLRRYDGTLSVTDSMRAKLSGLRFCHLNDIEVANGRLYANVWRTPFVAEIDQAGGAVTRILDCRELVKAEYSGDRSAIMNGIAYNPDNGAFLVTGKRWRHYYEICFPD
jgi:glutaminyl-peptide cyclotransferase